MGYADPQTDEQGVDRMLSASFFVFTIESISLEETDHL